MEYTTQTHLDADGMMHVDVPEEWLDQDVEIVIKPLPQEEDDTSVGFAETLRRKAGGCSFEVPPDLHERKGEIFSKIVMDKHHTINKGQSA